MGASEVAAGSMFGPTQGAGDMGSVLGAFGSMIGARQANEAQTEQSNANRVFNEQQADLNRQFQAQQVQGVEQWETQMSDTAMQRRVADLKAAGLNPLLAVGQGGATQPSVSPSGGSQAAYGSIPNIQNTGQAFSQLGPQLAGVHLANAQAEAASAQANKLKSETPTPDFGGYDPLTGDVTIKPGGGHELGDATLANIKAQTGATDANARQIGANIDYIRQQIQTGHSQELLNDSNRFFQDQQNDIILQTKQYLVQAQAAAGASARAQLSWLKDPDLGPVVSFLQAITAPVHAAASVVGAMPK